MAPQFEDINFLYLAEDGTYESVGVKKMQVNEEKGRIKVVRAELNHYSRYGFGN